MKYLSPHLKHCPGFLLVRLIFGLSLVVSIVGRLRSRFLTAGSVLGSAFDMVLSNLVRVLGNIEVVYEFLEKFGWLIGKVFGPVLMGNFCLLIRA